MSYKGFKGLGDESYDYLNPENRFFNVKRTLQREAALDRVAFILENYTLEDVLEMNELTSEEVLMLLYMAGHIKEPEAYLP